MAAELDLRTKKRYLKLFFEQCFESGMFMPDPDRFYLSRIPNLGNNNSNKREKEKGEKNFVVLFFFKATDITKLKIIIFLNW
jgi:hypothetical protein